VQLQLQYHEGYICLYNGLAGTALHANGGWHALIHGAVAGKGSSDSLFDSAFVTCFGGQQLALKQITSVSMLTVYLSKHGEGEHEGAWYYLKLRASGEWDE
jgi:hypothetical protein